MLLTSDLFLCGCLCCVPYKTVSGPYFTEPFLGGSGAGARAGLFCSRPRWPGPLQHHVRAAGRGHRPGRLHCCDSGSSPVHRPQGQVWVSGARGGTGQLAPLETASSPSPCPIPPGPGQRPPPPWSLPAPWAGSDPSRASFAPSGPARVRPAAGAHLPLDLEHLRAGPPAHSSVLGWFCLAQEPKGRSAPRLVLPASICLTERLCSREPALTPSTPKGPGAGSRGPAQKRGWGTCARRPGTSFSGCGHPGCDEARLDVGSLSLVAAWAWGSTRFLLHQGSWCAGEGDGGWR